MFIPIRATCLRMHKRNAVKRGLQDWFVVDIDAHHVESVSWKEIVTYIEDPVIRDNAMRYQAERIGAPPYGLNGDLGLRYQSVGGRIPHQDDQREVVKESDVHRDVTLTAARDGFARRGQHGGISDPDAVSRHASADRNGGLARAGLQPMDGGQDSVSRRPNQNADLSAIQYAEGGRTRGRRVPATTKALSAFA